MRAQFLLTASAAAALLLVGQNTGAQEIPVPRSDTAIAPVPADDPATATGEDDEAQGMIDRRDWINQRFGGPLDKDFFERTFYQIQNQVNTHPELLPNGNAPASVPRWKQIGPIAAQVMQNFYRLDVVDSGRIRTILPHPTDPETMYLLSSGGGLWKTTNFSSASPAWTAVTDSIVTTSGGAVALGNNPNTIYLGLGDPYDGIALLGGYMLRSLDGGATWSPPINLPTATIVTDVKVSTGATDTVYVGTNAGLYVSNNGGNSYTLAAGIPSTRAVSSLVQTSAGMLAATYIITPGLRYGEGSAGAMYLSTDNGATFAPVANAGNGYSGAAMAILSVGTPGDQVVYAFASSVRNAAANPTTSQRDLFRSVDGGQTWQPLGLGASGRAPLNPNSDQTNLDVMHGQAFYNQMLVVDPSDPNRNTVHIGGNLSAMKSTDGGQSWAVESNWLAQFGLPYVHADFHAAAVTAAGGVKRLLFGTDGGLFVSENDGSTWSDRKNIGLVNQLLYSVTGSGTDSSSVLIGLQDNGTRLRIDGAGTFNQTKGGDGFGVGWSQSNGKYALGSYVYNRIARSMGAPTDQSKWINPSPSPSGCAYNGIESCNSYFYTTVYSPGPTADPSGMTFFARSFNDVWRTINGGASWTSLSSTDSNRLSNSIRGSLHPIATSPTDLNRIVAAATGGKVRVTTNGGGTWTTSSMPSSVTDGFNSSASWINASSFYMASENPGPQGSACWMAKTTDLGATWQKACTGLPQVPISRVLVSPADPTGLTAYAATWIGVYRTVNGGRSWDQFGAGLPVVKVSDLYMPPKGGLLRVATYGRGVWEIATPR